MSDSSWWVEIVFLAMLAGFIALRLVAVLGRRTGHEPTPGEGFGGGRPEIARPVGGLVDAAPTASFELPSDISPELREPLQAIAKADPRFDPAGFVGGAKGAYRMILEAFWGGDLKALDGLVSDEIAAQFRQAVDARKEQGLRLENKLLRIERATIVGARMQNAMAEVTVRFDADLSAVTRDAEGRVVAGSTSDAVQTHDVWTFSRHTGSTDPNWLLIDTDDE